METERVSQVDMQVGAEATFACVWGRARYNNVCCEYRRLPVHTPVYGHQNQQQLAVPVAVSSNCCLRDEQGGGAP